MNEREEPEPPSGIELTIEIPPDVTDDQIVETVRELVLKANEYHRAMGGQGIESTLNPATLPRKQSKNF